MKRHSRAIFFQPIDEKTPVEEVIESNNGAIVLLSFGAKRYLRKDEPSPRINRCSETAEDGLSRDA